MRFFIPEWDDQVDPKYDFICDEYSMAHTASTRNDVYMWEIFKEKHIPFDGVLVSLMSVKTNGKKEKDIEEGTLHKYLRLPDRFPILADCGAWGYMSEETPRFNAIEVLAMYRDLGVQEAVTVDHLVVSGTDVGERMKMTLENGISGFQNWKKHYKNDFNLLVSVQGLTPEDYLEMYCKYAAKGIESFAFGGLAKKPTKLVIKIIDVLINEVRRKKNVERIHFFGLGRTNLFSRFKILEDLGVDISFDTASWLRRAWLSGEYLFVNSERFKKYTAIRVPMVGTNRTSFKGKRKLGKNVDLECLRQFERESMDALKAYEQGQISIDSVLLKIRNLDEKILRESESSLKQKYDESSSVEEIMENKRTYYNTLEKKYRKTLEDRPWTSCNCEICKDIGIEVILFRGNNRNRRRGFHNVYTMYHKFLKKPEIWYKAKRKKTIDQKGLVELNGRTLVIVQCTKKKVRTDSKIRTRAEDLYLGRIFKLAKFYAKIKRFPLLIISAKYGLLQPDEIIEGYDEILRTNSDIEEIKAEINRKLSSNVSGYDSVLVIAGEKYRQTLSDLWDDRFVYIKSKGYGDLCKTIKEAIEKLLPKFTDFAKPSFNKKIKNYF